jgi:hypothetical protein
MAAGPIAGFVHSRATRTRWLAKMVDAAEANGFALTIVDTQFAAGADRGKRSAKRAFPRRLLCE